MEYEKEIKEVLDEFGIYYFEPLDSKRNEKNKVDTNISLIVKIIQKSLKLKEARELK